MTIDEFAPQVSFFFYTHNDFFEEIAKYRAGRRRWAASCGSATARRTSVGHVPLRLSCAAARRCRRRSRRTTSCGSRTRRWRRCSAASSRCSRRRGTSRSRCPTEESTTLALRTQQILAHETGVARTVDPLGGSYFVESLTDAMEAQDRRDHGRPRERTAAWSVHRRRLRAAADRRRGLAACRRRSRPASGRSSASIASRATPRSRRPSSTSRTRRRCAGSWRGSPG